MWSRREADVRKKKGELHQTLGQLKEYIFSGNLIRWSVARSKNKKEQWRSAKQKKWRIVNFICIKSLEIKQKSSKNKQTQNCIESNPNQTDGW